LYKSEKRSKILPNYPKYFFPNEIIEPNTDEVYVVVVVVTVVVVAIVEVVAVESSI
jgi:hypothetical protein